MTASRDQQAAECEELKRQAEEWAAVHHPERWVCRCDHPHHPDAGWCYVCEYPIRPAAGEPQP